MRRVKEFDLNIEKILENWEIYHAIREIIANAFDEQILTKTKDVEIFKHEDVWHIRDYGRGLNYHHLTQNENEEKINSEKLIGRFGVGLKDALATFYRHNIKVIITSRYGVISLTQLSKKGFEDITTLHAVISEPDNQEMVGTDVSLFGCSDNDMASAKELFLKFSNGVVVENTKYGQIICNDMPYADIYINGVKVAEEPNFLFSYNITSLNKQLKKALNRERTNVGRNAYTERIKSILTSANTDAVILPMISDLQNFASGKQHDELNWGNIALDTALKMAKLHPNATFITFEDYDNKISIVDEMKMDNRIPVIVSSSLLSRIKEYNKDAGDENALITTDVFIKQQESTYETEILELSDLSLSEKNIYLKTNAILDLIGGCPSVVKEIVIVKELYQGDSFVVNGTWDPLIGRISIRRHQLSSIELYAATLLHECAHAISNANDISRDFESQLTEMLGKLTGKILGV